MHTAAVRGILPDAREIKREIPDEVWIIMKGTRGVSARILDQRRI